MTSLAQSSGEQHDADWFQFPFQAYPIQVDLMNAVYSVIDQRQIGLLESPTGTGKSLSLFCGAMKWLRDHEGEPLALELEKEEEVAEESGDIPAWALAHKKRQLEEERAFRQREHVRIQDSYQSRLRKLRFSADGEALNEGGGDLVPGAKRRRIVASFEPAGGTKLAKVEEVESIVREKDEYLMEDYESDGEEAERRKGKLPSFLTSAESKEERDLADYPTRKIFYCSRTHSQLSQFIDEVKKTHWSNQLRLVVLASRKTLCINPSVNKLPTTNLINDKCLDLISSKPIGLKNDSTTHTGRTSASSLATEFNEAFGLVPEEQQQSQCKFLHEMRQKIFRDDILATPKDVEELVAKGQKGVECPYFASRASVQHAELVILPYQSLLHAGTREALGIDLRGNIVILDEAHNLIDTINAIHSVELTLEKMTQAYSQLSLYFDKYRNRLKANNTSYIEKLLSMLRSLIKYMDTPHNSTPSSSTTTSVPHLPTKSEETGDESGANSSSSSSIVTLNDFLFDSQLDTHNLFKIGKYMKDSDIIHKTQGFCQTAQVEISVIKRNKTIKIGLDESEFEKHRPALGQLAQFLATLTTESSNARLLVTRHHSSSQSKLSSIKYILLNPEAQFQPILKDARAVILAGGTLQPFDDFYQHLLVSGPQSLTSSTTQVGSLHTGSEENTEVKEKTIQEKEAERVFTFSCSHIVPDSNLLCLSVSSGPTDVEFNFTYENRRMNDTMFDEVGNLFSNLCNVVPDGVVLFSPSYHFEDALIKRWMATGAYDSIMSKKPIFREPRTTSNVDSVLAEYENCIAKNTGEPGCVNGAVLSCVVGGKLSEGINFKDHLGRLVIVLGLPFPNARDPILIERLAHINHKLKITSTSTSDHPNPPRSDYYENLCMKAVNQSIGRSIRHINDYACILLIDKRYTKPSISGKLPRWIQRRYSHCASFGDSFKQVVQFFRGKSNEQVKIQESRRSAE